MRSTRSTRSTRSRTSQRRSNSKSQTKKKSNTTTRRVQKKKTVVINLDLAKRIVQEACIAAVDSAGKGSNVKPTPIRFPKGKVDANTSQCDKNVETIFADFVRTTISRTVASMRADTKTLPSKPKPPTKRKRSRKRRRPLPSKVQGLEHADPLYTMCSLFPVLVSHGESSGDERNTISYIGGGELDVRTNRNESSKEYANLLESINDHNNNTIASRKTLLNGHHNDYDSLLPPVGTSSAGTTPTKLPLGATFATRAISHSPRKQQKEQYYHMQHEDSFIPPILGTNPQNDSYQALSSPSESRRDAEFLQKKDSRNEDDGNDHCSYEQPLLGVVGDDGSDLVNRNDYFGDNHHLNNIHDDTDATIQIVKV